MINMMKHCLWLLLILPCLSSIAQDSYTAKTIINEKIVMDWEMVKPYTTQDDAGLSEDGKYFFYFLEKWFQSKSKLIIQSTKSGKQYKFDGARSPIFVPGGINILFLVGDTLNELNLRTKQLVKTVGVKSFQLIGAKKSWLTYDQVKGEHVMVLKNLVNGKIISLKGVGRYIMDKSQRYAILSKDNERRISWLDLENGQDITIWNGKNDARFSSIAFDKKSKKIAFVVNDVTGKSIWMYDLVKRVVKLMVSNNAIGLPSGKRIGNSISFSGDGNHICFDLEKDIIRQPFEESVKVKVWNFRDQLLKNDRPDKYFTPRWCSLNINSNKIIPINEDGELIEIWPSDFNDFNILRKDVKSRYWEGHNHYLNQSVDQYVNLESGERIKIPFLPGKRFYMPSSDGKYIFCLISEKESITGYSLHPKSGTLVEITGGLSKKLFADDSEEDIPNFSRMVGGWLPNQKSVIIYDQFDIWKLDLDGKKPPINLTGGYGRRNKIKLRISKTGNKDMDFANNDRVLLTAFNVENKENGYYRLHLAEPGKLDSLSMRPWISDVMNEVGLLMPINDFLTSHGFAPKKADKSGVWLVFGKSATDAPNFYLTGDLKKYKRLTDYQPQKEVNWYTSELVRWKNGDGRNVQGVLYKPTNFDSTKRYPVIISHYRMLSQLKNEYILPNFTEDAHINIPWFVTKGYLVLLPDVYLTKGGSGPASMSAILPGVKWLQSLSYVDRNKIGLAGHSQAGFQSNYISANSNVFACIFAGAGGADWLSSAFRPGHFLEVAEDRNGLPWESDIYTKQSAILKADKMNTPLLMFHCPNDDAVPFKFSVDYFTALWRLGKPAWLLEYNNGGHSVNNELDARDLTTRVMQFFDHYLKGIPAPVWMTQGAPGYKSGIKNGLELDPEGTKTLPSNPYLKN